MAESTASVMTFKRSFKKDSQAVVMMLTIVSMLLNFVLVLALSYVIIFPVEAKYYGTIVDGRSFPLIGLKMPNQSDAAVTDWANQAAISAYTLDFVNYEQQLKISASYFTRAGWSQYVQALNQSNTMESIRQKKVTVSAVAQNTPVILRKGMLNGRYSWRIQLPILITYVSASSIEQQTVVVTMLVNRISTLESARGIGISQFIVGSALGGIG